MQTNTNGGSLRLFLMLGAGAALCALGLLTLLMIGVLNTGLAGLIVGMVLAVLPVPIYVALALWVDRYEKEPLWMLGAAFLWGATGAVFFSFIINSIAAALFGVVGGAEAAAFGGSVISAPLVEETAKGAALLLLYLWKRDEFDNVIDGVVYAAMVGLGFAMTENVSYYGAALQEGTSGPVVTFVMRGMIAPFSHPLFTAMFGIGLGLSRETLRAPLKVLAPLAGLAAAMFLHATWNFSAGMGEAFFGVYVLVMVPAFAALIGFIVYAQGRERKIIRANLFPYAQNGALTHAEVMVLSTFGGRLRVLFAAFSAAGVTGWRRERRFQQAASELAFHRWRLSRGISQGEAHDGVREAGYLRQVAEHRARPAAAPHFAGM